MEKETFFHEYKGILIVGATILIFGFILLLSFAFSSKSLTIMNPIRTFSMKAGEPLTVAWSAKGISRVGIVLFNGDKPQWIKEDYPASAGKFVWTSNAYQTPGSEYKIAIFEYPWRKGNVIKYTYYPFNIIGPKYASCDDFSIQMEWPFIPSGRANIHRVFITDKRWSGNLGGVEGADAKCKQEAAAKGYEGNFIAFIGTDSKSAVERIAKDGVMVEADPVGALVEGRACYRFLAENVTKLLDRTRSSKEVAEVELSDNFADKLSDVWYGRRVASAGTKCLELTMQGATNAFSGTYTCQNWTLDKQRVYTGTIPEEADLPKCYNSEGKSIVANYYGASAGNVDARGYMNLAGDACSSVHHLMCIEQ